MMILNRSGEPEKQPWQKGNSWLIQTGIKDIIFNVTQLTHRSMYEAENITTGISDIVFDVKQVYYTDMYGPENLTAGIADISFIVTKV